MKRLVIVFLAFFGTSSHACTCSEDEAFERGFKAIVENGWASEDQRVEFEVLTIRKKYVVMRKDIPKDIRGNGHPEATVHRETCEIVGVSLAR